ncbi:MAG TPA: peroxiredoxin, partial [Thermoanaerobaculia bacterium]
KFDGGWALGQPDLVLSNAQPYTPPTNGDMYRCFTMPTNLTEDQYVSAIDVKPGDRQTVHHVIAFIDTSGDSQRLDDADPDPGYKCFGGPGFTITNLNATTLGGWAPGARPVMLPPEVAFSLPKASRIVLQVHYHPHGPAPLPDQTQIGIYYAKRKPQKLMRVLPLINDTFTIPPGDANYRVTADFSLPIFPRVDAHVWLIAPHMHLLGRKMHVDATPLASQSQCLINIDDWDFNWQGMYRFKDPLAMPAGTKLSLEAFYDNSPGNFRNPNDPPKAVSWGEATTDEMCIAFVGFTIDSENLPQGIVSDASWIPKMPR